MKLISILVTRQTSYETVIVRSKESLKSKRKKY